MIVKLLATVNCGGSPLLKAILRIQKPGRTAPAAHNPPTQTQQYAARCDKKTQRHWSKHARCENCMARVFRHGSAPCPVCRRVIKRLDLQTQTFEDLYVEREVRVRKRILRIYNMRREDFKTLQAYNDYLEQVEDIVLNLVNEVDVAATEAQIERYKRANQEAIQQNLQRQAHERRAMQLYIAQEQQRRERALNQYREAIDNEDAVRATEREAILNELACSDRPAHEIVSASKQENGLSGQASQNTETSMGFTELGANTGKAAPHLGSGGPVQSALNFTAPQFGFLGQQHQQQEALSPAAIENPFDTLEYDKTMESCYSVRMQYFDPPTDEFCAKTKSLRAGGFDIRLFQLRSIESAFADILSPTFASEEQAPGGSGRCSSDTIIETAPKRHC